MSATTTSSFTPPSDDASTAAVAGITRNAFASS
jgi:hypothetical protein